MKAYMGFDDVNTNVEAYMEYENTSNPTVPSSGPSDNYDLLKHKPSINGRTLVGNLDLSIFDMRPIFYGTTAYWDAQWDLIAQEGVYVYTDHRTETDGEGNTTTIPGIKIGDGKAYLSDIPFLVDEVVQGAVDTMINSGSLVSAADRAFWDNKVTAYVNPNDAQNLVLSRF